MLNIAIVIHNHIEHRSYWALIDTLSLGISYWFPRLNSYISPRVNLNQMN